MIVRMEVCNELHSIWRCAAACALLICKKEKARTEQHRARGLRLCSENLVASRDGRLPLAAYTLRTPGPRITCLLVTSKVGVNSWPLHEFPPFSHTSCGFTVPCLGKEMQCNAVQCNVMQCNAMQCHAVPREGYSQSKNLM